MLAALRLYLAGQRPQRAERQEGESALECSHQREDRLVPRRRILAAREDEQEATNHRPDEESE